MPADQDPTMASMPPAVQLYFLAIGFYVSRALHLAAKLGIADLIADGQHTAEQLAKTTETHAPSLRRVLRLLTSAGVFAENKDGSFALTPLSEALRTGVPGSARHSVMLFGGGTQDIWADLMYTVQTGEPAFRRAGFADPFERIRQDPEGAANFDAAMADFTKMAAIAVAAAYDFSKFRTLVDVGGGSGALIAGILKATPTLRGILFDRPDVAERGKRYLAESGLEARCEVVGGDFFKEVPRGADAYIIKHVIHDWNDEQATAILKNCRSAIAPNGKLLVFEGVYPEHIDQSLISRGAASNDVNMLVATGGRQRSEAEFHSLFKAAAFELTRIVPTPARVSVIEGVTG